MTPDRWAEIDRIFKEVCDLDAAAQDAKLAELCGQDRSLRRQIELLLHEDSGDFLEAPAHLETPSASAAGELAPGDFDGFEVIEVIGRGGQGTVYRAREGSLDRDVALKVLPVGWSVADEGRFLREARAVAQLSHPHVVGIHGYGEHAGHCYYVMEHVGSGSLTERIVVGERVPDERVRDVAAVALAIAKALAYAHSRGIVHRDLKPSNILFDEIGNPKLVDFGLAKLLQQNSLSVTADLVGTPQYIPPEVIAGDSQTRETYVAGDIYSYGATFYHWLMGTPPFHGEMLHETLHRIGSDERAQLDSSFPKDLRTIVDKCLEKRPADRYATADELVTDLECFIAGEPISAAPLGPWRRAARSVARRPFRSLLVVALLVTSIVAVIWGVHGRYVSEQLEGMRYLRAASEQLEANPRLSLLLALEGAERNPGPDARKALYAALAPAVSYGHELSGLSGHTDWVRRARFDSLGQRVVTASRDATARVHSVDGPTHAELTGHRGEVFDARFDRSATRVVTASLDGTARVWGVEQGVELAKLECGSPVYAAHFVADDNAVLTASADGHVRVWSSSGELQAAASLLNAYDVSSYRQLYRDQELLALSGDRRSVAALGSDERLRCWDARTLEEQWSVDLEGGDELRATAIAFHPNRRDVAVALHRGAVPRLYLCSAESGGGRALRHPPSLSGAHAMAWNAAGDQLAVADGDEVVVVDTATDKVVTQIEAPAGSLHALCFIEGGRVVARGLRNGVVGLFDVESGRRVQELRGHGAPLEWIVLDATASKLISVGEDRRVRLWHVGAQESPWAVHRFADGTTRRRAMFVPGVDSGEDVALCGDDLTIRSKGQERTLPIHARHVVRGDDSSLVVVTAHTVEVWRDGSDLPKTLHEEPDPIRCATATPDARRIAIGTTSDGGLAGRVAVHDRKRGTTITWKAHAGPVRDVAFDSRARRLATASLDRTVGVWSTDTGECEFRLDGHGADVRAVAFHPQRPLLASGGWDGRLILWDLTSGRMAHEWRGFDASVERLEWLPDGSELFSVSYGGEVRFWNVAGQCVSLQTMAPGITYADLAADGSEFLLLTLDGQVHRVPYPPDATADRLRPSRDFYERELVALGFAGGVGTEVSSRPPDRLQGILDCWASLRQPAESKGASQAALADAKALHAHFEEPHFTAVVVALALYRDGAPHEAYEMLQRLNSERPDDPVCLSLLALAATGAGHDAEVVERWKTEALSATQRALPGTDDARRFLRELGGRPRAKSS